MTTILIYDGALLWLEDGWRRQIVQEREQFGHAERFLEEAVAFAAGLFADGGVDEVAGHENEKRARTGAVCQFSMIWS